MKKQTKRIIIICMLLLVIVVLAIPVLINEAYKINKGYYTVWEGADVLAFYGSITGAIGTIVLGIIAWQQNNRLLKLEENTFLAQNACSVLIDEIVIEEFNSIACNLEFHDEQIVYTDESKDSQYYASLKINFKIHSLENKPALVHIKNLLLGVNLGKRTEMLLDASAKSVEYSRVAISKECSLFCITLIMAQAEKERLINAINNCDCEVILNVSLSILTDKYVASNLLCRASLKCIGYDEETNIYNQFKSKDYFPPVFFWQGNEVMKKGNIKIKDIKEKTTQ